MTTNMSTQICGDTPTTTIFPFERKEIDSSRTLNPDVWKNKEASNFFITPPNTVSLGRDNYSTAYDGRLINAARGGQLTDLDSIPMSVDLTPKEIMDDKSLDYYGQNYKGYEDVNAGQIKYHIDKDLVGPYHETNFQIPCEIKGYIYKDPMGALKPEYYRKPTVSPNCPLEPVKTMGCLSDMHDSICHREDIMSRQMRKRNQQRWETRWYK